jgi:hypothetical protein
MDRGPTYQHNKKIANKNWVRLLPLATLSAAPVAGHPASTSGHHCRSVLLPCPILVQPSSPSRALLPSPNPILLESAVELRRGGGLARTTSSDDADTWRAWGECTCGRRPVSCCSGSLSPIGRSVEEGLVVLIGEKFPTFRVGSGSGSEEERIGEPLRLIPWSGRARGGRRRLELRRRVASTGARQGSRGGRAGRPGLARGGSHSGGRPCRGGRRGRRRSAGDGAAEKRSGAAEKRSGWAAEERRE